MGLTREEQQAARRKALLLLEHMDRTEKGLSDRLRQAGFCAEAVEDAVAYVSSFGYVDDGRYAENYIAYRIQSKSRRKILQELLQKGVDKETAQTAWEQVSEYTQPDEQKILKEAVLKKCQPGTVLDEKGMRRLQGFPLRRGFGYSDISHVLEELQIQMESNTSFCK